MNRKGLMKTKITALLLLSFAVTSFAQAPSAEPQQFIRVEAPVIALVHVRVVDGTGAVPQEDQTVVVSGGKIDFIGPAASAKLAANVQILDLHGYTVLPGL